MKVSRKILSMSSMLYLYLPVLLFLFGWTKWWIAIITSAILLFCIYRMLTDKLAADDQDDFRLNKVVLFLVVLFFMIIGYFCGWGRWVVQSSDWAKHNTIMQDLVERSWPVYYRNGEEHSMLTYYIAQYLVPAFVGKILGSYRLAEIMNYVWAEIGLILVWIHVAKGIGIRNSVKQCFSAGILVFFSGPLWLAQITQNIVYSDLGTGLLTDWHWMTTRDGILLQYSSNFALLRWVYPQVLAVWIILVLFIENKDNVQYYCVLMLPGVIFGTLSFIGLIPLGIGYAGYILVKDRAAGFRNWFFKVFSLENILTLCTLGTVLALYFYGNVFSSKPESVGLQKMPYGQYGWVYFIFVIVHVMLYVWCILADNKKNIILHLAVISLWIIPLFKMGLYNDWGMRCSIPGLFIVMFYVMQYMNTYISVKRLPTIKYVSIVILLALLFCGSVYPLRELLEVVRYEDYSTIPDLKDFSYGTMENYANRYEGYPIDLANNYYSYDLENNIFYKYAARKTIH